MTDHTIGHGKSGQLPAMSCSPVRRSTPAWATSWRGNGASCPGSGSRRSTVSTPTTARTLAELFDGRGQLLVYHFMFCASYKAGCPT
jgi:hypothetical protein